MTTGEILKMLITTDDYEIVRAQLSNQFIDFIKEHLPRDYEYIREKEEKYQQLLTNGKS